MRYLLFGGTDGTKASGRVDFFKSSDDVSDLLGVDLKLEWMQVVDTKTMEIVLPGEIRDNGLGGFGFHTGEPIRETSGIVGSSVEEGEVFSWNMGEALLAGWKVKEVSK
jgi:hypothetical protein